MKMFGLLDFGERADSGIPDLFDICNSELDTQPDYDVTYAPARTTLTIDTSKMARTERTIKADDKVIVDDNDKADDKRTIKADDNVTCDVAKVLLIVMKSGIHSTVTSSFSLFFLHVRKILRNFAVT